MTAVTNQRVVIVCDASFLILADASSIFSTRGYWSDEHWAGAKSAERRAELKRSQESADVFQWYPLMDGTYAVDISLGPPLEPSECWPTARDKPQLFSLQIPTGSLAVVSYTSTTPALALAPGTYRGGLFWNFTEEVHHWSLGPPHKYPSTEGPDGIVKLWKAE